MKNDKAGRNETPKSRVIVAQLGARMHYAIPRILYEAGLLEHFYTDICAVKGWPSLLKALPSGLQPAGLKRLLGRVPKQIPPEKITSFTSFGWQYYQRQRRAKNRSDIIAVHLWSGQVFCNRIIKQGFGQATGVYTFNSAGLELLKAAKTQDLRTIMEQTIAPQRIERQLLREEQQAFPDWESPLPDDVFSEQFSEREQAEWGIADVILCGSEFVREGIVACGGPVERCAVVPYGVDVRFSPLERPSHQGPLRVLTVGAVSLRKGSPYILETARRLKGKAEFRMVGSIQVLPQAEAALRAHIALIGPVPRTEILKHYAWADVFLLPSLCEGSATVVYEALATGLPAICTPNTGSVVRDGVDGYIVPVRDAQAIAECIERLAKDASLFAQIRGAAAMQKNDLGLTAYQQRLLNAIYH